MSDTKIITFLFVLLCVCTVISILFGIAEIAVMIFTSYDSLEEWGRAQRIKKKRKQTEHLLNDIQNLDCKMHEIEEEEEK